MSANFKRWIAAHPAWTLVIATILALAPFLAKPFNIDDPLFLWTAKQILAHPADPLGFDVNWYGEMQPIWSVTENPPLAAYYLALAGAIFGWGEIGLHLAFLLPAIVAILGTYRLAQAACGRPLFAALATLSMPVFLLSSTTLMCDVPMLALWVWAIVFWVEGAEKNDRWKLFAAAVLVSLAALTKYFGVCLIPLLVAYSLFLKRRFPRETVFLLIPVILLCVYQWITRALYGSPLLSQAAEYATFAQGVIGLSRATTMLAALSFCGGCLATAVVFAPWLWRKRTLAIFAVVSVAVYAVLFGAKPFWTHYASIESSQRLIVQLQMIFWVFGGISVLGLATADFRQRRDALSCLLWLWIFGTFIFAALFNWTVNGRTILPMAPAAGILLARCLGDAPSRFSLRDNIGLAVAATLALLVVRADFIAAQAARESAMLTVARYSRDSFYFQGHWGFQYYMEAAGMRAFEYSRTTLKPGDLLALPADNTSVRSPNPDTVVQWDQITVPGPRWLATMNPMGAGFYASSRGPLPFAFGKVIDPEIYIYHLGTNAASSFKK